MSRFNQILIAVLVIQLALTTFILWPSATAQAPSGPLLADFSAADVTKLTIQDGEGNQLALVKNGDKWIVDKTDNFPADSEKISPFLEKLEGIKTNRLITKTEASHKRLKVAGDDFNRLLELTSLDGSSYKLYLGSSAGAGATHVRVDDQPEVYLTDAVSSFEASTQASGWIDTQYYTIPETTTVALTLENQNGTFEFEKDGENWVMKGLAEDETLKESAVTGLVSQATSVRMTAPLGKEEQSSYGLDEPLAVVTLKTGEGDASKTQALRIGAKDDKDSSYVASYSESPYYVRVSQYTGNNFVDKTRDDFLEPPPTPEAGGANSDAAGSN